MTDWNSNHIPILQLGSDFYDPVAAAAFPRHELRYWNASVPIQVEPSHFYKFHQIKDNLPQPLALRYHGHQFQHYNPDLGDGRGFLYAQVKHQNQWYDFGTKGSGQTPYSRSGDGKLTLKGAMREALATEMLESLGVRTSKTLCFFETGEDLERNDEPSPTRSAVLTRFSLGHIRIGTFQRLAFFKQLENIRKLTSYCIHFYYQDLPKEPADETGQAALFLEMVVNRNAELVGQIMMAGFVHGVLNTDNINISGELFDYGPYRFAPKYDPDFTAAYFDHQGLYSYGRQPVSFLWSLHQFAGCLKLAFPELQTESILAKFSGEFNRQIQNSFLRRLNLKSLGAESDAELVTEFFNYLDSAQAGFEEAFFNLHSKRNLQNIPSSLLQKLQKYEINDLKKAEHPYFKGQACTLLIDEIESIWKQIAEKDDWSVFEAKLQSIRAMREIY